MTHGFYKLCFLTVNETGRCGHCLAVCPTGAISIFGKTAEAREMLGIPQDHYMKLLVGFGYPEMPYARGVQKGRRKVHRWAEQSGGSRT